MVEKIIEFCARNRLVVLLGVGFALLGSFAAIKRTRLDAIPDLSDPQVIVFTEWMGRSPTLVEDQVTYPIVSKLIGTPHVTDVRGFSMFGMSFVYAIFEEGTDIYWARSRVLEYMNGLRGALPEGVTPTLGPDATGIGWVFQYTLTDKTGKHGLDDLRTFQDFTLRYALGSVPGVAEVASVGGYQKQYQVTVDPNRLRAYGVTLVGGDRRHPPVEQRRGRAHPRVLGPRVLRPRARLHQGPRVHREDRGSRQRLERNAAARQGSRDGAVRPGHPARASRVER